MTATGQFRSREVGSVWENPASESRGRVGCGLQLPKADDYVNWVGWIGGVVQTVPQQQILGQPFSQTALLALCGQVARLSLQALYCDFFYYYARSKWYGGKCLSQLCLVQISRSRCLVATGLSPARSRSHHSLAVTRCLFASPRPSLPLMIWGAGLCCRWRPECHGITSGWPCKSTSGTQKLMDRVAQLQPAFPCELQRKAQPKSGFRAVDIRSELRAL